jgi:hypothetical protein
MSIVPESAAYRRLLPGDEPKSPGGAARNPGELRVPVENGDAARAVSAPVVWLIE